MPRSVLIDMSGRKCGRWRVLERSGSKASSTNEAMWLCRCECGTERRVLGYALRSGLSKSCGCFKSDKASQRTRGDKNPMWKGGRSKHSGGYVLVHNPEHPRATKNGQVLEHIAVMTEHLGRQLKKGETVHHVNGVRDDNRIENLELWSSSHPPGQRAVDKIAWAKQMIADYEPKPASSLGFLLSRPAHELRVGI